MSKEHNELIGQHFQWICATSEIEDLRNGSRRPDSDYRAKVDVYEDRVKYWFLDVAKQHVAHGMAPGDYVALSIGLAYIEGVEQYRKGKPTPRYQSGAWFKTSAKRIFPRANPRALDRLWDSVRNGLFHTGFTKGPTLVSHAASEAIDVSDRFLRINPSIFVDAVIEDFNKYIKMLRSLSSSPEAVKFLAMWDKQWSLT